MNPFYRELFGIVSVPSEVKWKPRKGKKAPRKKRRKTQPRKPQCRPYNKAMARLAREILGAQGR